MEGRFIDVYLTLHLRYVHAHIFPLLVALFHKFCFTASNDYLKLNAKSNISNLSLILSLNWRRLYTDTSTQKSSSASWSKIIGLVGRKLLLNGSLSGDESGGFNFDALAANMRAAIKIAWKDGDEKQRKVRPIPRPLILLYQYLMFELLIMTNICWKNSASITKVRFYKH